MLNFMKKSLYVLMEPCAYKKLSVLVFHSVGMADSALKARGMPPTFSAPFRKLSVLKISKVTKISGGGFYREELCKLGKTCLGLIGRKKVEILGMI